MQRVWVLAGERARQAGGSGRSDGRDRPSADAHGAASQVPLGVRDARGERGRLIAWSAGLRRGAAADDDRIGDLSAETRPQVSCGGPRRGDGRVAGGGGCGGRGIVFLVVGTETACLVTYSPRRARRSRSRRF